MSSKDAYKLLNFVSSDNEQVNVESLDAKYNRPDIVLKSIEAYFKK
jgi:hypothetical protein